MYVNGSCFFDSISTDPWSSFTQSVIKIRIFHGILREMLRKVNERIVEFFSKFPKLRSVKINIIEGNQRISKRDFTFEVFAIKIKIFNRIQFQRLCATTILKIKFEDFRNEFQNNTLKTPLLLEQLASVSPRKFKLAAGCCLADQARPLIQTEIMLEHFSRLYLRKNKGKTSFSRGECN